MMDRRRLVLATLVVAGCAEAQPQDPGAEVEVGATFDPNASPIAAVTQLTQGWTTAQRAHAIQESLPLGHLEMGVTPSAFTRVLAYLQSLD